MNQVEEAVTGAVSAYATVWANAQHWRGPYEQCTDLTHGCIATIVAPLLGLTGDQVIDEMEKLAPVPHRTIPRAEWIEKATAHLLGLIPVDA